MTAKTKNIIVSIFSLLFSAFIFIESLGIKAQMRNDMGSGFFPRVIAVAIAFVAVIQLIMALREKSVPAKESSIDKKGGYMTILLVLLYVTAFQSVGFIIATVCYLYLQILVLTPPEKLNLPFLCGFSFAVPLFIYTLFVYAINTPLPKGLFGF